MPPSAVHFAACPVRRSSSMINAVDQPISIWQTALDFQGFQGLCRVYVASLANRHKLVNGLVHLFGIVAFEQVAVNVHRHRQRGMTKPCLHDLGRET